MANKLYNDQLNFLSNKFQKPNQVSKYSFGLPQPGTYTYTSPNFFSVKQDSKRYRKHFYLG